MKVIFLNLFLLTIVAISYYTSNGTCSCPHDSTKTISTDTKPSKPTTSSTEEQTPTTKPHVEVTADTAVKTLLTKQELEAALNESGPKAFKFFGTWCGPCKKIKSGVAQAALKYKDNIKSYAIDIDNREFSDFAKKHNITGLPTILFLPSGRTVIGAESNKRYEEIFGEIARETEAKKESHKVVSDVKVKG
jgi:thiol-disulfide isomerase/thioredoxin